MKNSAEYAKRLKKLLTRLKKSQSKPEMTAYEPTEPLPTLIMAALSSYTTLSKANIALKKLENEFVDFNELRVCRIEEVVEVLGKSYPQVREVAKKLIDLLMQIYEDQNSLTLSNLNENGKREAKAFLEKLPASSTYVASSVMQQSLGGHAFPVNRHMMKMLQGEDVVNPNSNIGDVQGFLERQISASDIIDVYNLLRSHADSYKEPAKSAKKTTKKSVGKTKNTTAKKAAKKKVKKKTAKKKKTETS